MSVEDESTPHSSTTSHPDQDDGDQPALVTSTTAAVQEEGKVAENKVAVPISPQDVDGDVIPSHPLPPHEDGTTTTIDTLSCVTSRPEVVAVVDKASNGPSSCSDDKINACRNELQQQKQQIMSITATSVKIPPLKLGSSGNAPEGCINDEKKKKNMTVEEISNGDPSQTENEKMSLWQSMKLYFLNELWFLFKSCWAIIITNICNSSMESIEFAFAGQLGETQLASAALSQAFFNCCSYILIGLVSAQTTLISQAEGVKNSETMKRAVLKRSFLIITVCSIPLISLMNVGQYIIGVIERDAEIVHMSGAYLHYYSLALLAVGYCTIMAEYMVAQSYFIPPMCCAIAATVVDVLANLFLTRDVGRKRSKLGLIGAPISAAITRWFHFLFLCVGVICLEIWKYKKQKRENIEQNAKSAVAEVVTMAENEAAKPKVSWIVKAGRLIKHNLYDIFHPKGIWEYMKIGIPGAVMLAAETWNLEISTLIIGFLRNPLYLSAHSVIVSISVWIFTIPFSISTATSVRVGYCLGSGQPYKAKISAIIGISVALIFMLLALIFTASLRHQLPKIFTSSKEIIALSAILLPMASTIQILDGLQTTIGAILQGMGNQYIGAVCNIVCYYCIGLPVSVILIFTTTSHVFGLWAGIGIGLLLVVTVLTGYVLVFAGFSREVPRAKRRVTKSDSSTVIRKRKATGIHGTPRTPTTPTPRTSR